MVGEKRPELMKKTGAFFKKGMTRKVISLLFMFGTVPLLILSTVFLISFINIQKKNTTQIHKEISERISAEISSKLKKIEGQVRVFGRMFLLRSNDFKGLEQIAFMLLEESLEYDIITVADTSGDEIIKVSRYYSFRPFELGSIAGDPEFSKVLDGQTTYSPVRISKFSKFPLVTISFPLTNIAGKIHGVLAVGVNVSKMWELISRRNIGENRYAYITDSNGMLIAYQDISSVLQEKDLSGILGVANFLSHRSENHIYRGINGDFVIGAAATVEPTGWGVIVEAPVHKAFRNVYVLSAIFLALSLATIAAAIFLGFWFSLKTIVRPIRLLQEEASAIAQGGSEGNLPVIKDELGQLAESFKQMVNDLKKTTVSRDILVDEIDGRKRVEKKLRASEEKLRNIVENSTNLFYSHTATHEIYYISPQSREFLQCEPEEAMNQWTEFATDNPINQKGFELTENAIKTGKRQQPYELELMGKKGKKIFVEVREAPILKNGKTVAIVGSLTDITDRKMAEQETAKLQSQLIQSQKLESIGTLAGGIAHDFNNILSSIIGFTELALDDAPKGTSQEDNLQEVCTAAKRARDLVKQILAFASQSDEDRKPIRVDAIAKEVIKLVRSTIPTTIEIKENIESDSLIMGNATQVHQLLMNLCTNAAHAMEDVGGILEVRSTDVELNEQSSLPLLRLKSGNYMKITVSDTGHGIPQDILGSIFEPYFTTKGPGEGTGMGLAMVHGIVESYGGQITVDSALGEGTTFKIYLPITRKKGIQRQYEPEQLPTGTEKILFVDDEAPIAKMGSQSLERLGYSVTTRTSSVEALELFRSKFGDFDLVITDMTMPNMAGDKLAVELIKIRSDIPVIICTGYSKKISDESVAEIGIKAFAYKPVVKADLAKTVRKVLDEAKTKSCN